MRAHPRVAAFAAFAALTVPFGTAVHLIAEFAGGGIAAVVSPRHAYLAAFDLAAFAALALIVRAGGFDRRRVALLESALPWRGRGPRFAALGALAQLTFFGATIAGEQSPLCASNLALGVCVAVAASLAGTVVLGLVKSRVLEAVVGLVFVVSRRTCDAALRFDTRRTRPHRAVRRAAFCLFVPNRPPPATFLAA